MTEYWWRSWHGAPMDHKWSVIAARTGIKPGVVSAIAWALFDYASQQDERGTVDGFDVETYAVYSGFTEDEISSVIHAMTDKEIIVDGKLAKWDKRQPKSETEIERVRNYRKKKECVTERNETTSLKEENTVTEDYDSLQNVTKSYIDTDTDTDTDTVTETVTVLKRKPAKPVAETLPSRPKIIKIPHGVLENVMLTDQEYDNFRDKCATENIDPNAIMDELSTYIPNKPGKPYKSHYAALLTFLRTSIDRRQKTPVQAVGGRQQSQPQPQRGVLGKDFVALVMGDKKNGQQTNI